jgi:Mrp family chromosome partitioning ATPase
MTAKNSLILLNPKYFNNKVQLSGNRRKSNQLIRLLKRNLTHPPSAGSLQELRDNVCFRASRISAKTSGGCIITLSGLIGREGASTVTLLLAMALSELRIRKVLFIDGSFDTEKFNLYKDIFGLSKVPAAETALNGELSFYNSAGNNLCFLFNQSMHPLDFFSNLELDSVLGIFKENFDYILFDMPPILKSSETKFLARKSDLFFLVLRPGKTLVTDLQRAKSSVADLGGQIGGVILNRQSLPIWARFFGKELFL